MKKSAVYIGTVVVLTSRASFAQDAPATAVEAPPAPRIYLDQVIATGGAVASSSPVGLAGSNGLGALAAPSLLGNSWVSGSSQTFGNTHSQGFRVAPSLDVRVSRHLLVGGTLGFQHNSVTTTWGPAATIRTAAWDLQALARLGYLTELGHGILLVPRVGLGADFGRTLYRVRSPQETGSGFGSLSARLETDLTLWIPLRGPLYLSAGPSLRGSTLVNASADEGTNAELTQNATRWSFGASAGLSAAF